MSVYISSRCYNGYTLFSHMGHTFTYTNIYLIDMLGNIEFIWHADQQPHKNIINNNDNLMFGTSIASSQIPGMQELDTKSNTLWSYHLRNQHDFRYITDKNILVEFYYDKYKDNNVRVKYPRMQIIDKENDNKVLWEWRMEDHLDKLWELYKSTFTIPLVEDWAHNNSCALIPKNDAALTDSRFKEGNIIFSLNYLNVIGIIDYPSGDIVWLWGKGTLDMQHCPEMQENGRIILFDNGVHRKWSRILELDPISGKITWQWPEKADPNFYSEHAGSIDLLSNGNILVCSADQAWIFELTREGQIVWSFKSDFFKEYGGIKTLPTAKRYSKKQLKGLFKKINKTKKELKRQLKDEK